MRGDVVSADISICDCPDTRPGHYVRPPIRCTKPAGHAGDHVRAFAADEVPSLANSEARNYIRARWSR